MEKIIISTGKDLEDDEILCPHCQARNPSRAYCCLTCFKVIKGRKNIPIWKRAIQMNRAGMLFSAVLCLLTILVIRKWLSNVETHLETIQAQNYEYHKNTMLYLRSKAEAATEQVKMPAEEFEKLSAIAENLETDSAE